MSFLLEGKQIVLGVSGGIAAYKSAELVRLLTGAGAGVRVVMTENAGWFIGATTFEALSSNPVCTSLFERGSDAAMRHIDWAQSADAMVVAPATANIVGKMAGGIADDALSTFLTAVTCPVLLCPAMNTHMFESRAVQRNLDTLRADGVNVLTPGSGELACGTVGPGRLPDPADILDRLARLLCPKDLVGRRVLVTAGPTHEFLDPVRYITNPSTGKMGFAVARAAEYRGADVILVSGPAHMPDPANMTVERVTTAEDMAEAVFRHVEGADIVVKTAAVSDYRPKSTAGQKIKKGASGVTLEMVQNTDILLELGRRKRHPFLVGFAAETENLDEYA
ncbi:MAG: bifunctional phosphopantothenoylcysteine decarboxylase/phosphopantothenate--cysteine ligase CoaBC, partial [Desulfobacteraceae bacterium]|nr:bifunctional phosphopantothenoylcysteine decarboxylase/phosphopantothenate--cysteine ligase CoaBC [Desulfobacteraceae bacterium]